MAKFAYNNIMHSSTRQTPLSAHNDQHFQADLFQVKNLESFVAKDLARHIANNYSEITLQL